MFTVMVFEFDRGRGCDETFGECKYFTQVKYLKREAQAVRLGFMRPSPLYLPRHYFERLMRLRRIGVYMVGL